MVDTDAKIKDGYLSFKTNEVARARLLEVAGETWRDPKHGVWVLATPDGKPLSVIRTLGIRLPKKDRRLCVRVQGVVFSRIVPLISETQVVQSDLVPYTNIKAAKAAVEDILSRIRAGELYGEPR